MNRLRDHQVASRFFSFGARIGLRAIIQSRVHADRSLELGDFSYTSGPGTYAESAQIGRFCSIARQTVIGASGKDMARVTIHDLITAPDYGSLVKLMTLPEQKPAPMIGNDVWIGINAVIMRGVTIGDGAANSVLTMDVAPLAVVGGTAALVMKRRFAPDISESMPQIVLRKWDEATPRYRIEAIDDRKQFVTRFG